MLEGTERTRVRYAQALEKNYLLCARRACDDRRTRQGDGKSEAVATRGRVGREGAHQMTIGDVEQVRGSIVESSE